MGDVCWFLVGSLVGGPVGWFVTRMLINRWERRAVNG